MAFPFLEKMVSYSYVRRWYFDPKTNQDIYLEYESYVTDCTDMEDVLQMLIGTPEKGISFRLSSSSFTAEALLPIAESVQLQ